MTVKMKGFYLCLLTLPLIILAQLDQDSLDACPAGEKGQKGEPNECPSGPIGPRGPRGEKGDRGFQGSPGEDGLLDLRGLEATEKSVAALQRYLNLTRGLDVDRETAQQLATGYVIDLARETFRRQYAIYTKLAEQAGSGERLVEGEGEFTLPVGVSPCSMKCGKGTRLVQTATCDRLTPVSPQGTRTRSLDGSHCRVEDLVSEECHAQFACHDSSKFY